MRKVLYSKFSKDREKKYQIQTLILEQDGEKKILKKPIHEEGKAHLEKRAGVVRHLVFRHQLPYFLCSDRVATHHFAVRRDGRQYGGRRDLAVPGGQPAAIAAGAHPCREMPGSAGLAAAGFGA